MKTKKERREALLKIDKIQLVGRIVNLEDKLAQKENEIMQLLDENTTLRCQQQEDYW